MKSGPDIARVAALIGDPARANMLAALCGGEALTAGELARQAGVTAQPTASAHLARLRAGSLVRELKAGRHRYFALADETVGAILEQLMGLAERTGQVRARPGPAEPALRAARVCYDHLAGEAGVAMLDALTARGRIAPEGDGLALTAAGKAFAASLGVDVEALGARRRPLCRPCLDWSQRRPHLAGSLGAVLLARMIEQGWMRREAGGRALAFQRGGRAAFEAAFEM